MTPGQASIRVEWATDDDLRVAVQTALDEAGLSLEEVTKQGIEGRFTSWAARWAWFMVRAVGDRVTAA